MPNSCKTIAKTFDKALVDDYEPADYRDNKNCGSARNSSHALEVRVYIIAVGTSGTGSEEAVNSREGKYEREQDRNQYAAENRDEEQPQQPDLLYLQAEKGYPEEKERNYEGAEPEQLGYQKIRPPKTNFSATVFN